eukprot:COSAG01_NODE_8261_length_2852_cov_6.151471_2_plen_611_part_00
MSVLEKVRRERMGISESPHVAHHSDWAEPSAARVQPVNLEEQWRKDLEVAGAAPRYGKKNGDYYEGVVNEQGMGRPGEKMPVPGSLGMAHHRYGPGVADPARPKTPPFAWSDGSGTVPPPAGSGGQNTADASDGWRKNLDEAMSGPRFTKSYGNFHTERAPGRRQPSASRRKADVEGTSTFMNLNYGAQPPSEPPTGEPAQDGGSVAAGPAEAAAWAHTRVTKPAPYLAHEQEWQHNQTLESESIMGRKSGEQRDYAQAIKDAQPDFNFSKSHGDYHIKQYRAEPRLSAHLLPPPHVLTLWVVAVPQTLQAHQPGTAKNSRKVLNPSQRRRRHRRWYRRRPGPRPRPLRPTHQPPMCVQLPCVARCVPKLCTLTWGMPSPQAPSSAYSRWKNRDPPPARQGLHSRAHSQQAAAAPAPASVPAEQQRSAGGASDQQPAQNEPQPAIAPAPTDKPTPTQAVELPAPVPAPAPRQSTSKPPPSQREPHRRPDSRGGQYEHAGAKVFQNSWSFSDQGLDGGISAAGEYKITLTTNTVLYGASASRSNTNVATLLEMASTVHHPEQRSCSHWPWGPRGIDPVSIAELIKQAQVTCSARGALWGAVLRLLDPPEAI